jgi:catechol 2,3-dioxygenase
MSDPLCRTGHLTLRVRDLARSCRFYEGALNFSVIEGGEEGRVALGPEPGDGEPFLVLVQADDPSAEGPVADSEPFVGMEHFAFELEPDDFATLRAAYRRLKDIGAEIHHTVNHRVTNSIYFLDPDGNQIEVYINCPRETYKDHMDHPYASLESLDDRLAAADE